jgi:hypothetical protein
MREQPDSAFPASKTTGHPTRDHIGASVHDLSAARAKRQQATDDDIDLEAFLADAEAEQKLPRERISPEALAELRAALIPVMGGPAAGGRATVLHSVLYAMVRELLDQRANVATVRGAWEALQKRRVPRAEFDGDIECVALCGVAGAELEILCNLDIVLGEAVARG